MGGGLARTLEAGRGEGRFSTRVVARYAARERPGQAFDVGLPEVELIESESKSVSSHEFWSACIRVNGQNINFSFLVGSTSIVWKPSKGHE